MPGWFLFVKKLLNGNFWHDPILILRFFQISARSYYSTCPVVAIVAVVVLLLAIVVLVVRLLLLLLLLLVLVLLLLLLYTYRRESPHKK